MNNTYNECINIINNVLFEQANCIKLDKNEKKKCMLNIINKYKKYNQCKDNLTRN